MRLVLGLLAVLLGNVAAQAETSFAPHWPRVWQFSGGPVATLAATAVTCTGCADGTYSGVALQGGSGSGALATIVVSGGGTTATFTLTHGGAPITATGALGYLLKEQLTVPQSAVGGAGSSTAATVTIATTGNYQWTPPAGMTGGILYAVSGAGPGGWGGSSSGGGGGGGGASLLGYPIIFASGATLTLKPGTRGTPASSAGAGDAAAGGATTLSGMITANLSLSGGSAGSDGSGTTGGTGGSGGAPGQGSGGAHGANGGVASTPLSKYYLGGYGGAGGGSSTETGGSSGSLLGPWGGAAAGTGNASGGAGARSVYGDGGRGGNGTTPSTGASPANGYGGGGGGGGPALTGAYGAPGMISIEAK